MRHEQRVALAHELIQCLGMWEVSVEDAKIVAYRMLQELREMKGDKVPNILAGSGMKALDNAEPANVLSNEARSRIFHEPQGDLN